MGRTSHSEQVCKGLLDWYFPSSWRKQENIRPTWLRNPKTGRRLELDRYYPDQKLAFEYDGVQHGRYIKGMHKNPQAAIEAQARDMAKVEQCRKLGITLYKFTAFSLVQQNFEPSIKQIMKDFGLLEQFHRTTPPRSLYLEANRINSFKIKTEPVQPYRKPGLWPLLQRMWKGHQRWKKGQSKEIYG